MTACIQPSFAVTDAAQLGRPWARTGTALAYPWEPLLRPACR